MRLLVLALLASCAFDPAHSVVASSTGSPWTRHTIFHDGVLRGADGVDLHGSLVLSPWEQANKLTVSDLSTGSTQIIALPSGFAPEGAAFGDYDGDGAIDISTCGDASKKLRIVWGPSWSTFTDVTAATGMQRWLSCAPAVIDAETVILAGGRKTSDAPNASIGYFTTTDARNGAAWTWHPIGAVGLTWTLEHDPATDRVLVSDGGDLPGLRGTRYLARDQFGAWTNHPIASLGGSLGLVRMADFGADSVVDGAYSTTTGNHAFLRTTSDWLTWTVTELPVPSGVGQYQSATRGNVVGDAAEDVVFTYVKATDALSGVAVLDGATLEYTDIGGPDGVKYDGAILHDVDGDGDLDVITSEHKANTAPASEQLGVIWYENPGAVL